MIAKGSRIDFAFLAPYPNAEPATESSCVAFTAFVIFTLTYSLFAPLQDTQKSGYLSSRRLLHRRDWHPYLTSFLIGQNIHILLIYQLSPELCIASEEMTFHTFFYQPVTQKANNKGECQVYQTSYRELKTCTRALVLLTTRVGTRLNKDCDCSVLCVRLFSFYID